MRVASLKDTKDGIRCDRSSIMGNPFEMKKESDRPLVIEACRRYLWLVLCCGYNPEDAIEIVCRSLPVAVSPKRKRCSANELLRAIDSIPDDSTLLCWCAPKPCHCDVIIKYREWKNAQPLERSRVLLVGDGANPL